jgi:hypothetical protein
MTTISFARQQFPSAIIRHAVWLYVRFTLSFPDVEDFLAERGLDVSYETVRRWVLKFGPLFARELRRRRSRPTPAMASRRDDRAAGPMALATWAESRVIPAPQEHLPAMAKTDTQNPGPSA